MSNVQSLSRSHGARAGIRGVISVEVTDAVTGRRIEEECSVNENIVTDVGLVELMRLANREDLSSPVTFEICVGDNGTEPEASDTELGNNVYEATITSRTRTDESIAFKLFIDTTQANGNTLREAGLKHNNVLIDHALLSATVAKDSSKNVTVSIVLTLERV